MILDNIPVVPLLRHYLFGWIPSLVSGFFVSECMYRWTNCYYRFGVKSRIFK